MYKLINNSVLASEIAEFLNGELHGPNIVIYGPGSSIPIHDNTVIFVNNIEELQIDQVKKHQDVLILSNKEITNEVNVTYIVCENPDYTFIKIINKFFSIKIDTLISDKSTIIQGAILNENVSVYQGSYIGSEVIIGKNTIVYENVIIKGKVKIGNNCIIKANSVIGSEIFNFSFGENHWEQFPQIGQIIIEDDVWIGANTTIEKGTLKDTIIMKGVKVDDLVQIGSGTTIGYNSMIAAGTIISKETEIGNKCWISPNVSIIDNIKIGNNVIVGIGSVVIRDVKNDKTIAGNPASELKKSKGVK